MLNIKTANHFNSIANTWKIKEWVNSISLNKKIDCFIRSSEKKFKLNQKKYKTSLYFGIGTGILFKYLKRYNIAGVDKAPEMLKQCPEGIIQLLSDIKQLPFLMNNQFNLTFSRNLLKHCEDPFQAVKTMYQKVREGGLSIAIESIVLNEKDRDIPTQLVRMTDPMHPPFMTREETLNIFFKAGYKKVNYLIIPHRSAWLKRWLAAEQAAPETQEEIIKLYKDASVDFKDRHEVVIKRDEIISTVPWMFICAVK